MTEENTRDEITTKEYLQERQGLELKKKEQSFFDFLFLTGTRVGEALKVKNRDLNITRNDVSILTEKNPRDPYRKVILYPLNGSTISLLENINTQAKQVEQHQRIWDFPQRKKQRTYCWELSRKHFGCTAHSFRHTHATQLTRDLGLTQVELMNQMGWITMNSCLTYLKYETDANIRKKMGYKEIPKEEKKEEETTKHQEEESIPSKAQHSNQQQPAEQSEDLFESGPQSNAD